VLYLFFSLVIMSIGAYLSMRADPAMSARA
ncbi:amino acid ABC transporter permease, partial [Rhizobium leguminosarum]